MSDTGEHSHRRGSTDLGTISQTYVKELKSEITRIFDYEEEVHEIPDSPVMYKQVGDPRAQHEQSTSQHHLLERLDENKKQELMATVDKQFKNLRVQYEQLTLQYRELERLHENKKQELMATLDKQAQLLKSQIENNRQLNKNNLQLKEDNRQLHENNLQLKEDNRQLNKNNLQLKEDNRQLNKNNLQLKEDNRQLNENNLQLKEENRELNEEIELTWRLHSDNLDSMTRQLDTIKAANKTLTNDLEEFRKRYEQLDNECRVHVQTNSLLKRTLEEEKNMVNDLSNKNESLKRQKKYLLDKISDISNLLRDKLPTIATIEEKQQLPPTILGKHYDTKGKLIWWAPKRAGKILAAHDQLGDDIADILRRLVRDLSEIPTGNDDNGELE